MEQHPVPRNISGFQFRLIGDMTLKQFAYLAGGFVIAFFIFKSFPLPSFFKYLFAGVFAISGVAFAFLPIQERPLDKWLAAFIKSIYSPSQYLWRKEGILPTALTMISARIHVLPAKHAAAELDARMKLRAYLTTLPKQPHQTLNIKEKNYLDKTLALFSTIPVSPSYNTPTPIPAPITPITVTPLPPIVSEQKEEGAAPLTMQVGGEKTAVSRQIAEKTEPSYARVETSPPVAVKSPEILPLGTGAVPPSPPLALASNEYDMLKMKLEELSHEKESLARELDLLKSTSIKPVQSGSGATVVKPVVDEFNTPTIKAFTPKTAVEEIGMPNLPQFPNLIIGVVKDEKRLILPNILITIKDKNGVPLRALKTNKLGQFATATPLPNGTYLIEIEDPLKRFAFDVAEIVLSGKIFLPIEVTARSQKEIMREQLSKALFSNPTA